MKKYLITTLFLVFLMVHKSSSQTNDTNLNALLSINDSTYVNQPLDSIISVLPQGYIGMKIFGISNTARFLRIKYSNKVWIELHVRSFTHMNPVDENRVWDISLMRLEVLNKVSIYKGGDCFRGCPSYD